jgi:ATP-binding cassette subfamily C (CFTR/MRP) protein 1
VRSAISIVPQSPDLFEGTLRENIDPVGEHSDADIWIALDQVFILTFCLDFSDFFKIIRHV